MLRCARDVHRLSSPRNPRSAASRLRGQGDTPEYCASQFAGHQPPHAPQHIGAGSASRRLGNPLPSQAAGTPRSLGNLGVERVSLLLGSAQPTQKKDALTPLCHAESCTQTCEKRDQSKISPTISRPARAIPNGYRSAPPISPPNQKPASPTAPSITPR